jgi:hypothetical protein
LVVDGGSDCLSNKMERADSTAISATTPLVRGNTSRSSLTRGQVIARVAFALKCCLD